ncbi:MAG: hypothetical protein QNI89_11435 [Desulfobacterales bacterium]|nr:hypothetical protein [Desulfobacterales bacterium]
MAGKIKVYKIGDFIRYTETGDLDVNRSLLIVNALSIAAKHHLDHHILLDLRETDAKIDISDVMAIAAEFGKHRDAFQNKIAVLIPNTEQRLELAKQVKACMELQSFRFNQFIDFEKAMEWLSE